MKRVLILLSIFTLISIGCSKPESKSAIKPETKAAGSAETKAAGSAEKALVGKWKNPTVKGFVAEFKNDHKGTTVSVNPANPSETAELPFKWTIESDGTLKITEGKKTILGKLVDKKLEIDFDGTKTFLEKAN